ncbi:MAG: hypothetical protein RML93_12060, partial [Anaerolineales bacterium]|nr:hypothetical protein [Anaerolineales bacterium]MDW8448008.1 hypothetical protein [Anaerolineales bacterium]
MRSPQRHRIGNPIAFTSTLSGSEKEAKNCHFYGIINKTYAHRLEWKARHKSGLSEECFMLNEVFKEAEARMKGAVQ